MFLPFSMFAAGGADHWSFFSLLGLDHHYSHVVMAAIATIAIAYLSLRVHRAYDGASEDEVLVPERGLSLRNVIELVVQGLYGLFYGILGEKTDRYFYLLASVFLFIFVNNLMGIVPGFLPATDNINTNIPIAVIVFVFYNLEGIREHGWKNYAKHFMGPVAWLAPLMVIIEVIGHIVRPVSLSLRLFGNMTGDHIVLGLFSQFAPVFVPIIFMGLGLFVSFVQAFVFTLLSSIYISLAVSHDH